LFGNVREWVVGKTGEESAGFAYNAVADDTAKLFLGSGSTAWVQQATGLRCLLRGNP